MDDDLTVNQRHLWQLREAIDLYRSRQLSFGSLINNLESLLGILESVPDDWKDEFLQEWGRLEDIYAVSLDRGQPELVEENQQAISSTLCVLIELVEKLEVINGASH